MIRNVEVDVERSELLELKVVYHHTGLVGERNIQVLGLLAFDVLQAPDDLPLSSVVLWYSILHLHRV